MTKIEKELIERIKTKYDGVVVTGFGSLYSRGGTYIAFGTGRPDSARTRFLTNFFDPFTPDETLAVHNRKRLRLQKYQRLIIKATQEQNFLGAAKLAQRADMLLKVIDSTSIYYENYFRLKGFNPCSKQSSTSLVKL